MLLRLCCKKHNDLFEHLLVLFQAVLSRHSQEPKFLPLTDQLTELWGLRVKVLKGDWYSRLQLHSTPSLWTKKVIIHLSQMILYVLDRSLAVSFSTFNPLRMHAQNAVFTVAYW